MPVPYRRTPRAAEIGLAAYLDVVRPAPSRSGDDGGAVAHPPIFYAGLLIVDGKGQPVEFVHNSAKVPSGLLWPDETVVKTGIPALAHSLFDACRREPDLVVVLPNIGSPESVRSDIAPAIPCAQVIYGDGDDLPPEWNWVNSPPSTGMRAAILADELVRRGFLLEPFDRLRDALRLVYPEMPQTWEDPDA